MLRRVSPAPIRAFINTMPAVSKPEPGIADPPARVCALLHFGRSATGLLHALVAMDMPGPGTVFLSQNWRFTAPVFIGDTITATAEVVGVHATKPVTQLAIRVVREDGETVLDGEAWCYTFSPDDS